MRALAIELLATRGFRNLLALEIELSARFNVFFGDNGQGKTNVLEALYVGSTSRSFRSSKVSDVVSHGADTASVRLGVVEEGVKREQTVGLRAGRRDVRVDGERAATLASYAVRTPVVVFHPGSSELSAGGGAPRRRLLDRVSLYKRPGSLADGEHYATAMRERQRLLETRGEGAADLDHWEDLVVRYGSAVSRERASAAAELGPFASRAFERIGPPGLALDVRYVPSAPPDDTAFREALRGSRRRDRARGSASVGPHRDDLSLSLGDHPVRGVASQGQHRAVVLALELAEIELIESARGCRPVLLLDDVSSELDRTRTAALFHLLDSEPGQVVVTTTRRDLIEISAVVGAQTRQDFSVVAGRVTAL